MCDLTFFQMASGGNGLQGLGQHGRDERGGKGPGTSKAGNLGANFLGTSGQSLPARSLSFLQLNTKALLTMTACSVSLGNCQVREVRKHLSRCILVQNKKEKKMGRDSE